MEFRYPKNTRFILFAMVGTLLLSLSCIMFMYNPLEMLIVKVTAFEPNSMVFKLWTNPPYDVLVNVYIYNVSNPDEFLKGNEKLLLTEVGPYVYKEKLYHTNISFNEDGTVSFEQHRKLHFMPEHSIGNPLVDTVLTANIPLLGITASLQDYSMFVKIALAHICTYLDSKPFLNLTINDYLYGYDDPLVTLANNVLPNWIDFPRFGIVERLMVLDNGSSIITMNINSKEKGIDNKELQKFAIQKWNGSPGMVQWDYKEANRNGTVSSNYTCDVVQGCFLGTGFPPHLEKGSAFRLYRRGFCRPVPIHYHKSGFTKDGFEAYTFKSGKSFLARPDENPDNDCYCRKGDCPYSGVGDLSPCYYGIPVSLSQPHFLNGDPALLEQIHGLSPDFDKHDFVMVLHPQSGLPLEATIRAQLNMNMPNTQFNSKTKPFNGLVLPLFWVELIIERPPWEVRLAIKVLYHFLPILQEIVKYVFAAVGAALVFRSAMAITLSKNNHPEYLEIPANYNEIDVFSSEAKLLESKV